jgi:hypothetical protein
MRWLALAIVVVLGAVWARAWTSSRAELAQARAAGDTARAITHFQYAMRWYTPGAQAPREAAEALWTIASSAPDRDTALSALQALRGGVRATRHLWSPFARWAAPTDRAIARLMAEAQAGQPSAEGRSVEALERWHASLLALDPTPAPGWSLVVVLGFVGWVAGGFATIYRGMDREAKVVRRPFVRWAGFTAASFALWIAGLLYA